MNAVFSRAIVALLLVAGCGRPLNPKACANHDAGCGEGFWCESTPAWSRCVAVDGGSVDNDDASSAGGTTGDAAATDGRSVDSTFVEAGAADAPTTATDASADIGVSPPDMVGSADALVLDTASPDLMSCMSNCVLDQHRCGASGGVETCRMNSACAEWGPESACPAGPANTVGTCTGGGTCTYNCQTNFRDCNGKCIPQTACCGPCSCDGLPATCGRNGNESCCDSPLVTGDFFYRSNDNTAAAKVSDFRLDKFEITVGRFRKFVTAGMGTQPKPPADGSGANPNASPQSGWSAAWNTSLSANTATLKANLVNMQMCGADATWTDSAASNETKPINCVTWFEAEAFCIWDGGRLPSEAEWNYAAAGGAEQRVYPWGSSIDSSYANYRCDSGCSTVAILPVGSRLPGAGKWGQLDLAGNVAEWTYDWNGSYQVPCTNCTTFTMPVAGDGRVRRGGHYATPSTVVTTSFREGPPPDARLPGAGARCVRAP